MTICRNRGYDSFPLYCLFVPDFPTTIGPNNATISVQVPSRTMTKSASLHNDTMPNGNLSFPCVWREKFLNLNTEEESMLGDKKS